MKAVQHTVYDALKSMAAESAEVAGALAEASPNYVEETLPDLDRRMRSIYECLDGCRRYLIIYREPALTAYDPIAVARAQSAHFVAPVMATAKSAEFRGDPEQVRECLRLIVENGKLTQGGSLSLELHTDSDLPRIMVRLNAGGLPENYLVAGPFLIPLEELRERWNAATAGGRLDAGPAGLVLNLRGTRRPPISHRWAAEALGPVSEAARALIPWRGAIGHYEFGTGAGAETLLLYRQILSTVQSLLQRALKSIPAEG